MALLEGKVAVITGAGRGIGRDHVKRLMRAHGIQGAKRRGKSWRTTTPDPKALRAPVLPSPIVLAALGLRAKSCRGQEVRKRSVLFSRGPHGFKE